LTFQQPVQTIKNQNTASQKRVSSRIILRPVQQESNTPVEPEPLAGSSNSRPPVREKKKIISLAGPSGSPSNPINGKTFIQAVQATAQAPKEPPLCTLTFTCKLEDHKETSVFTECHLMISDESRMALLYTFMFATTEYEKEARVCKICLGNSLKVKGSFQDMLQHAGFHSRNLGTCRNETDTFRRVRSAMMGNKNLHWDCVIVGCGFHHSNEHLLYFHFISVHKGISTKYMEYCPFCLGAIIEDSFIEHMKRKVPEHTFSCCNDRFKKLSYVQYIDHFVALHTRELILQLDQTSRDSLAALWKSEDRDPTVHFSPHVPIVSTLMPNRIIGNIFDKMNWNITLNSIAELINYILNKNEHHRTLVNIMTEPMPSYEKWKKLKFEILDKNFYPMILTLILNSGRAEAPISTTVDSAVRAERKRTSLRENSEIPYKKCRIGNDIRSQHETLKVKLQAGLPDQPDGLILTTSRDIWKYTPETKSNWLNLTIDVSTDIATHVVRGKPHLETPDGDLYMSEKSYFKQVQDTLSLGKWKDDTLVVLEYPQVSAFKDLEHMFMRASAYAASLEVIKAKFSDYHFVVTLPLLPKVSSIGKAFLKQLSAEVNGGAYIY
jgi:hypothetical protein